MAKDTWGVDFPARTHARTWADAVRYNSRYSVSSWPTAGTLAVNTTQTVEGINYGHVAWVVSVSPFLMNVTVTEMGCNSWTGVRTRTYPATYFNAGFISKR